MSSEKTKPGRTNALTYTTRTILWARAAGRCQYEGCNKSLIGDLISGNEDKNYGFVAHIVADTPGGPRGDSIRSAQLSNDVENVMLLCHPHHKLIDVDDVAAHPEERLLKMKAEHERRIDVVSAVHRDRASHVLRFAANIGGHESPVAYEHLAEAMLPEWYPAEGRHTIDIEIRGGAYQDHEPEYWEHHRHALERSFSKKVRERVESRDIRHLSVFALAPQPLLIELGRLLCDIAPATVYQLGREPKGWRWRESGPKINFHVSRPDSNKSVAGRRVALVLGLSATIVDERVTGAIGEDAAIWKIEAESPNNDNMRHSQDLAEFRRLLRRVFDEIKASHGENAVINVFPALPVSAAVEVGRVWMPKADLPMTVFDQNRQVGGFAPAMDIR
jgi:hypothetical protein